MRPKFTPLKHLCKTFAHSKQIILWRQFSDTQRVHWRLKIIPDTSILEQNEKAKH